MEDKKYCYLYPHPAVTTDCVIFGFDGYKLQVLLVQRGIDPFKGLWAFPGGFMRMDENAYEGALRELREETGLETAYLKQLNAFSDVNRDPRERVVTIAFYALVSKTEVKGGDDAAKADWFALDNIPSLAFDHDKILREAVTELRRQIHFEPIGFELLPDKFTMSELQRLYEAILDVHFDRRNFAKKMLRLGFINQLDETSHNQRGREANLYCFDANRYREFKERGFRLEF